MRICSSRAKRRFRGWFEIQMKQTRLHQLLRLPKLEWLRVHTHLRETLQRYHLQGPLLQRHHARRRFQPCQTLQRYHLQSHLSRSIMLKWNLSYVGWRWYIIWGCATRVQYGKKAKGKHAYAIALQKTARGQLRCITYSILGVCQSNTYAEAWIDVQSKTNHYPMGLNDHDSGRWTQEGITSIAT